MHSLCCVHVQTMLALEVNCERQCDEQVRRISFFSVLHLIGIGFICFHLMLLPISLCSLCLAEPNCSVFQIKSNEMLWFYATQMKSLFIRNDELFERWAFAWRTRTFVCMCACFVSLFAERFPMIFSRLDISLNCRRRYMPFTTVAHLSNAFGKRNLLLLLLYC